MTPLSAIRHPSPSPLCTPNFTQGHPISPKNQQRVANSSLGCPILCGLDSVRPCYLVVPQRVGINNPLFFRTHLSKNFPIPAVSLTLSLAGCWRITHYQRRCNSEYWKQGRAIYFQLSDTGLQRSLPHLRGLTIHLTPRRTILRTSILCCHEL